MSGRAGRDPDAPSLTVRLARKPDGSVVLHCARADGTATWQRHRRHAGFFPLHDLTHYAVETVLGFERGFWGLVAAGWDLTDFAAPWPRGPLPAEAVAAEVLVGLLDAARADGEAPGAEALNERAAAAWGARAEPPPRLGPDQLAAVLERRRDLFGRWARTPPGGELTLPFPAGAG